MAVPGIWMLLQGAISIENASIIAFNKVWAACSIRCQDKYTQVGGPTNTVNVCSSVPAIWMYNFSCKQRPDKTKNVFFLPW